ncbi:hypothetical protein LguiA_009733 [Lonicera macranthoides]
MTLFNVQNPWLFTFGVLGNIVSFMVYLVPVTTFYRIIKKKSTEGFHSIPYVVALFSSMLWIYYASLKSNVTLLITINSVGCVMETIYIAIYIAYAPKKAMILTVKMLTTLNLVGFWLVIVITHYLVKGEGRVKVLGWICLVLSVSSFAAPLSIMLPNILGFTFGVVQMVLYAIYKNCPVMEEKIPSDIAKQISTTVMTTTDDDEENQVCSQGKLCDDENRNATADQGKMEEDQTQQQHCPKTMDASNHV